MRMNYIIDKDAVGEEISRSFYKLAQKVGHIHCFMDQLLERLDLVNEMIEVSKKFNVKLSLNSLQSEWDDLYSKEQTTLLDWIEHLDYLGILLNDREINQPNTDRLIELIWELNGNAQIVTLLNLTNGSLALHEVLPKKYDRWLVHTQLTPVSDAIIQTFKSNNQVEQMVYDEMDLFINSAGELRRSDGKLLIGIDQSAKKIVKALEGHPFHERVNLEVELPYKLQKVWINDLYYKVVSGKAAFFDIEAVSRPLTNVQKHGIKDYPIPILYALIAIEQGSLKVKERHSYSVTSAEDLDSVYYNFFKTLKRLEIHYLIVSGGALERRFLENMMYVLRNHLSLQDVRYLFSLRDHLIDIQDVLDHPHNSDRLLLEFHDLYPDLITFHRKSDKLSIKISFILDGLIFGPKRDAKTLEKVIHYCFEDVYADFELFKFYCFLARYKLK